MNRSVLESFGSLPFRIRGACMAPAVADGETVTVHARRFYFPGDIVVFRTRAGDLAAHRMLGWRRAAIVTKGDGCEVHDPPVPHDAILGAVDVRVKARDRVKAVLQLGRIVLRRLAR
ncbi:MAG: S24/S26 family peptidase [Thermoanaerobaculia bacterium]